MRSTKDELADLNQYIAQMGGLAEEQLTNAIHSIERRDISLAEQTIRDDTLIDRLERRIEAHAIAIVEKFDPKGDDLRNVISAIKTSTDLERIGDLSKNIAKRSLVLSSQSPMPVTRNLVRMGLQTLGQLTEVLNAHSAREADRALLVWKKDAELDEIYNSLFRELVTYMMEDQRTISLATHLLFIAKNFERIGDHATNVAEIVFYLVNGHHLDDRRPKNDVTSLTAIKIGKPGTSHTQIAEDYEPVTDDDDRQDEDSSGRDRPSKLKSTSES